MFQKFIMWIFNIFGIQTQTTQKEVDDNQKYAAEYERIDEINFNSIFSNKLANYVINDSNVNVTGENARVELLDKTTQSMWKKAKKITSMGFGYGGVIIVPYVKGGKIYYSIVPQNRLTIDMTDGENITGATVLAEKKTIQSLSGEKTYLRWSNYTVQNGTITILQQFSDKEGNKIPAPDFWKNILEKQVIQGVDRVLFGYIKSPINNRKTSDNYGVPITYGCESTILEIKETMKQLFREYKLKEVFVGADSTMFDGKDKLPINGLFKKIDAGDDTFFEVFDPAFRPFTERLQELYQRLEHEIGTSRGILTEPLSSYQNTDETRRAMQDTASIIDAMRKNIEKGIEDFLYSANVLANAYNLTPQGEYKVEYDWSYYFIESTMDTWNQLLIGFNNGVVSKEELRAFIYPSETDEVREKVLNQIKEEEPSVEKILDSE